MEVIIEKNKKLNSVNFFKKLIDGRVGRKSIWWNLYGVDIFVAGYLIIFSILTFFLSVDYSEISAIAEGFLGKVIIFPIVIIYFVMQIKTLFFPFMIIKRFQDNGKSGFNYILLMLSNIMIVLGIVLPVVIPDLFETEILPIYKNSYIFLISVILGIISFIINIYLQTYIFLIKSRKDNKYGIYNNIKCRKDEDNKTKKLVYGVATLNIIVVFLIFFFIFINSIKFFSQYSVFKFFLGTEWVSLSHKFGFLPLLVGSLWVTFIAIIIAVPLSIVTAVYIAEYASSKTREVLKIIIETMAAIPSVVLGYLGFTVIAGPIKTIFNLNTGLTAFTGGIILAFMSMPTMISIADDSIRSLDKSYKQASLALGASKMQTIINVIFPAAFPGIFAAIMLGFGRIIGETMTVLMVTGNSPNLKVSALSPVRTMTATVAAEMGEVVHGSEHYHALFAIGFILFIISFITNTLADIFIQKARKNMKG